MFLLRKLTSVFRQQYLGALALFIALGGSAYAAATINSASVVDNSLTSADIQGRHASPGKPFTQGTITGADVKGSPAAPGRPAVNGGLTGADVADGSLTGADIFGGTVPNATKLAGHDSATYGQTTRTSHEQTADCDSTSAYNQCAKVTVTVPPGKHYRAAVYSSLSAESSSTSYVQYCPAVKSSTLALTCLTGEPPPGADLVSLAANYQESAAASGDTSALGFDLGQGTWTFSTVLLPGGPLVSNPVFTAHTTVTVTDATAPGPSGVVGTSGSSGTCTSSSGSTGSSGSSGSSSGVIPC